MRKYIKKKPLDIGKMLQIRDAFYHVGFNLSWIMPDEYPSEEQHLEYLKNVSPLVTALKNNEYDLIAASIPEKPMNDKARMKLQTIIFAYNLILKPKNVLGFEIELAKGEVILIIEKVFKPFYKSIPTAERTLSDWWDCIEIGVERAGITLKQVHGYLDPDLKKWIESGEQRIASGEITFAPNGLPMKKGERMFVDFPYDLRPL